MAPPATKRPRTRGALREEGIASGFTRTLTAIVETGHLDCSDLANLSRTCRAAQSQWVGNDVWKALALRTWPGVEFILGSAPTAGSGDSAAQDESLPECIQKYGSYRALFTDRLAWLEAETSRIRTLPEWSKLVHYHDHEQVECGRCGCNCNNGPECPGIPITSEFRYERKESLGHDESRDWVPPGEGYQMSGREMCNFNRFCEPCFERLVEIGVLKTKRRLYTKVGKTSLLDVVTDYILNEEGHPHEKHPHYNIQTPTLFQERSSTSWQKFNGVDPDDAAVVIAQALIQPNGKHLHLNLTGFHFNQVSFGYRGYKALAYAVSLNTTLKTIRFVDGECYCKCCNHHSIGTKHECKCEFCRVTKREFGVWYLNADRSKGMFRKALDFNKDSSLEDFHYGCPSAFGEWKQWSMDCLVRKMQARDDSQKKSDKDSDE